MNNSRQMIAKRGVLPNKNGSGMSHSRSGPALSSPEPKEATKTRFGAGVRKIFGQGKGHGFLP